jgi:nickel/cobalt transporter (NicO) family protein
MKRLLVVIAFALVLPSAASAHPLGNFTINHFARVQVAGERVYVRYVLDLAEIPAFQARRDGVDGRTLATRVARNLHLIVDGRRAQLRPVARLLTSPPGAGGLRTLRLEAILRGPAVDGPVMLTLRDRNDAGRIGWREIVVGSGPSVSRELRAYPRDLLSSPLHVTSARARVAPNDDPVPLLTRAGRPTVAEGGFTALVSQRDLTPIVLLAALAAALFWGAAHALSPGHGKTIVAAYLVGRRGSLRDAAALGAIVTVTHTIGVFAFGLVTLLLSQWIVPDRLYPWLNLAAGVSVVGIGLAVLRARLNERRHRDHDHHHHHHHHHHHGGLLAVGISGGILPCPSALVVLLAAISLHRVAFGLILIVAFSLGLALAITGVGAAAVLAKDAFARRGFDGLLVRALPAVSAAVILAAGVAMTVRALPKVS